MFMIAAQPLADHATHFAKLAQIASDDLYTYLLGKRANDILASLFCQPENDNSYQFTHFLKDDGKIAGMVNAWTADEKRVNDRHNDKLMRRYAGWRYLRYLAVGLYLYNIAEFIGSNLSSNDFYIQMVAIYPQFRGRGHSKTLLHHAHELAVSQGCRRLVLDVDERNTVAIAAYSKVGFDVIAESKKITEDGVRWGMLRMAKQAESGSQPITSGQ